MFNSKCEYQNAIRELDHDESDLTGWDIYPFNKGGQIATGWTTLMPLRRKRIAVRRDFYRSIDQAAKQVKRFLEPRIFQTRETTDFDLDLRIRIDTVRSAEIALRHYHEELSPQDVFYSVFANELRELLERSAAQETGSIDERIGRNRLQWQSLLETRLAERFGIGVEIIFLIEREVATDKIIRTDEGAFHDVYFLDRIDKTYPLYIDMRLQQSPDRTSTEALPRDETKLKNNLLDIVSRTCEQQVSLYHYWYEPQVMEAAITRQLNDYLKVYAHHISNIMVQRPDLPQTRPPVPSEKMQACIGWQDSRGYSLEFNAEARACIKQDGAGLYDKQGRKDRQTWFEEEIAQSLRTVLAGVRINDLEPDQLTHYNEQVEALIKQRAATLGLELELFFGSVLLPNQTWLTPSIVKIPADRYVTAHPKIKGHFSMDLELVFQNRSALEAFFMEYLAQRPSPSTGGGGQAALPDPFIEEQLSKCAREAAEIVMKGTDAELYFTEFIQHDQWTVAIPTLTMPHETSGADKIEMRLREQLARRYPGVELIGIHFHRLDEDLEALRSLIGSLDVVAFECTIHDRHKKIGALDRVIKGHVRIAGGDAAQVVKMLNMDIASLSKVEFRHNIREHLEIFVRNRLATASQTEIEALARSLTTAGMQYDNETTNILERSLRESLQAEFGLLCSSIELVPELSRAEDAYRQTQEEFLLGHGKRSMERYEDLKQILAKQVSELKLITGTTSEDNYRREALKDRIREIEAELGGMESQHGPADTQQYYANFENLLQAADVPGSQSTPPMMQATEPTPGPLNSSEPVTEIDHEEDGDRL